MKTFGLIGYPLSHSFSKKYFSEKFERENIRDCSFELFPLKEIDELPALISANPDLSGLSVTIPYKEKVIPFLDELDETAKKIGAVNCIRISQAPGNQSPFLTGYNTDVFGFRQSIKPFLETSHERALILGTGGASKAVYHVLKEIGIECYFVTRDKSALKRVNADNSKIFDYTELNEYVLKAFKLIVNTTPLGMSPDLHTFPDIPYQYADATHLLYDLVYNPAETEFLKKGKARGATTINGLSMLHLQAEEAWRIWNRV
jgi:shikimate dehydrogenase